MRYLYLRMRCGLSQDFARFGLRNQAVCIILQKIASPHQPFGGSAYSRDILFALLTKDYVFSGEIHRIG
jgi:hypothetical protein